MNVYITKVNGLSMWNLLQYRQWMTAEIAHQMGCRKMGIFCYNGSSESDESLRSRIDGIIAGLNWGEDVVVCQFPTGNGFRFEWELVNRLKVYRGRIVIFIHGSEPIVCESNRSVLPETIRLYNQAEVLIVPSLAMRQFLLDNGIRKDMKFVIQEMWDYTIDMNFFSSPQFRKEIHFTGSSGFEGMENWNYELLLKLYAVSGNPEQNINNMGNLPPGELLSALSKGGFGLTWYRGEDSRREMEYGSSFEMARYLAAGIPVIVPRGISNQTVIEKNHLGLVVNSLDEAVVAIGEMTESEYQEYIRSVGQFAQILRNGYYTKKCLIDAIQAVCRKDAGEISTPAKVYDPGEHIFVFTVLKESYGGNLALSWNYRGKTDGFLIYDTFGNLVYETGNAYQHYFLIKGYGKESGFVVKAYVDTLKGKLCIEESKPTYLHKSQYEYPKVSMIIPAYNAENYIARSVDIALAQSFSNLEIIIVDDGSVDDTLGIITWYAEKYPNIIVIHQENGGVASARNMGIKYASGEYIGFLDSDDMIHPEMIKSLYDSVKANDCDIAITSAYWIDNSGYNVYIQYCMEEEAVIVSPEEFFHMHFNQGSVIKAEVWNKLYRRSLVKKCPFPIMSGDDGAWTPYILSYADKICYRSECYYEWDRSIRKNTLLHELMSRSRDDMLEFYKNIVMFYLEHGNPKRKRLLMEQAKRQLLKIGRELTDDRYEKMWHQIKRKFGTV